MADSGMIDLGDLVGAAYPSRAHHHHGGFASAEAHGMISVADLTGYRRKAPFAAASTAPAATPAASLSTIERHSQLLTTSAKAATLASTLALEAPNAEERALWTLFSSMLTDAERSPSYAPEHIGINLRPIDADEGKGEENDNSSGDAPRSAFAPTRHWYITHYAFLQDLLMRHPKLRAVALLLRWLEASYGEAHGDYRSFRFSNGGGERSAEETRLMRETIRCALRAGRIDEAIRIADAADDGITACMLSAGQMRAHPEAWNGRTSLVPLFGEYAHSDEPLEWAQQQCCAGAAGHHSDDTNNNNSINNNSATAQQSQKTGGAADGMGGRRPWTTNKDRIDHLATLFEWAELAGVEADEATIAAILSGNEAVLAPAFDTRRWQDALWVTARCGLIKIFTKCISANGEPIVAGPFRDRFEAFCPPVAGWVDIAASKLVAALLETCAARLASASSSAASAGGVPLPLVEELQIGLIIYSLSAASSGGSSAAQQHQQHHQLFVTLYNKHLSSSSSSSLHLRTAVGVVATRAFADRLLSANPQEDAAGKNATNSVGVNASANNWGYASAIADYCIALLTGATAAHQPAVTAPREQLTEAARRCCQLLSTIADTAARARAAASIVLAVRTVWYAAFSTLATNAAATVGVSASAPSASPAIVTGRASPSSKAQCEERRLHVLGQEQWLLQLLRRYNASRFGADADPLFVSALLAWLAEGMGMGEALSCAEPQAPRLSAHPAAEAQLWRIALWVAPTQQQQQPPTPDANADDDDEATVGVDGAEKDAAAAAPLLSPLRASLAEVCADVRATVSQLWSRERHLKAITEVMAGYGKFIRPAVDKVEAEDSSSAAASSSPHTTVLAELTFWSYLASILSAWDALSTIAVHAAEAARDRCGGQQAIYAAEEQRLRAIILEASTRAVALQRVIVSQNPSCAGAVLKCVELNINAAVVSVNGAAGGNYGARYAMASTNTNNNGSNTKGGDAVVLLCQSAMRQVAMIHESIALADKADAAELFASFRMLRLDAGIQKLRGNVAAALE